MRILFATNHNYLPQMTGGSESSTNDLCNELIKLNYDVAVISSIKEHNKIWLKNRVLSKIKKKKFVADRLLGYPVYRGWNVKQGIKEVVNDFHPDVAIVQAGHPFELVNEFSRIEIPVVLYVRDIEFDKNNEKMLINKFVGFIANSKFTAQKIKDFLGVDALVIPPLVDPEKYIVSEKGGAVVHVGLVEKKGVEISFQLAMRRPDIPFVFVESWVLSNDDYLNNKRKFEKLKNVTLLRRFSDMRKVYEMAKILLVPSICEEAWGRVVTEAQFSGIPVISSDRGGLPESVGTGGLVVSYNAHIDIWEETLSNVWDSPKLYSELSSAALLRSQEKDISKSFLINTLVNYLNNHIGS
ncbi:MAG: glycosyltransferase [Desulfobacterium sp.]|nr:glycosyltransferase [Desulfobacterium sp.]